MLHLGEEHVNTASFVTPPEDCPGLSRNPAHAFTETGPLADFSLSTEEQTTLLDRTQDAIVVHDLEGRVLFWNKGAERIYGWTSGETIGRHIGDHLYPEPKKFREANANGPATCATSPRTIASWWWKRAARSCAKRTAGPSRCWA
jgi:PAS domain-containing protein